MRGVVAFVLSIIVVVSCSSVSKGEKTYKSRVVSTYQEEQSELSHCKISYFSADYLKERLEKNKEGIGEDWYKAQKTGISKSGELNLELMSVTAKGAKHDQWKITIYNSKKNTLHNVALKEETITESFETSRNHKMKDKVRVWKSHHRIILKFELKEAFFDVEIINKYNKRKAIYRVFPYKNIEVTQITTT